VFQYVIKNVNGKIYTAIIMYVAFMGRKLESLTVMEEHIPGVENKALRTIHGTKREEVTGDWRKLHNEKYHAFCSSPNIIRIISRWMRWVGHVARMGD
jgi:hypothetical protein